MARMDMEKRIRVAVIMGGPSVEHDISLKSGEEIMKNLDRKIYFAQPVVVSRLGGWQIQPEHLREKVDTAFVAMHGTYGEDGTVQSILELQGIPYTGSDARVSAMAVNKFLTLRFFQDVGLTIPPTILVSRKDWLRDASHVMREAEMHVHYPMIVKPNQSGSSFGVRIARDANMLYEVIANGLKTSRDVLVQSYIYGMEVTCGVLDWGHSDSAYALPPTEIIPRGEDFFDHRSKYDPMGALEITPARLPDPWIREIRRAALKCHKALGCRGMSRTDMIVGADGKLYILEINTIPGFTKTSLLPKAANAFGIPFSELLHRIVQSSLVPHS